MTRRTGRESASVLMVSRFASSCSSSFSSLGAEAGVESVREREAREGGVGEVESLRVER